MEKFLAVGRKNRAVGATQMNQVWLACFCTSCMSFIEYLWSPLVSMLFTAM